MLVQNLKSLNKSVPLPSTAAAVHPVGNPDLFQILNRVVSDASLCTAKAMPIAGGCVIQSTTLQRNLDGSYVVAEALAFVPNTRIDPDINGGKKLVAER